MQIDTIADLPYLANPEAEIAVPRGQCREFEHLCHLNSDLKKESSLNDPALEGINCNAALRSKKRIKELS